MVQKRANERTFQGELFRIINKLLDDNPDIDFNKITQEEQVGYGGLSRFADGKLYSKKDKNKIVSFELKDVSWDATDEILVRDAFKKASENGYTYFVTGNPRQLVIYKTFEENTPLLERKLKIYNISNVKKVDDILLPYYEKQITPKVLEFLKDLSNLVHGVVEVHWDSIDKYFVNKLSAYILEASEATLMPLYNKIKNNANYKRRLKQYLKSQDIFNVTLSFDYADVYKIAQLSNYILYLKIIFYSYIQRDVPKLELKPLDIPLDIKQLNKVLRKRFDKVLEWDYESIFSKTVLDEITFEENFLPVLKQQVKELNYLDFKDLKVDIIGAIYNTLIDNQEQHDRGQHFTNTNEVDIVNGFCIDEKTETVIDTGCGAGTFLVRAYKFLQHFHPQKTHEQLLEQIWGIEIAPFPVFLSTMNLCLLNIKSIDNYPIIINKDFCEVHSDNFFKRKFKNQTRLHKVRNFQGREAEVKLPDFDACVGNPPYIRQELIEDKKCWLDNVEKEWHIKKIDRKSDLYVYYLMHTASLLKEGKRLGYVISSSWLDVGFGKDLQAFLLQHFKIIAIIEHQNKRSFETASINTVILIIEKCADEDKRNANLVKFVRVFEDYSHFIGKTDDTDRIEKVLDFTRKIENTRNDVKNDDYLILVKKQAELFAENFVGGKFVNGHWGAKYLRDPGIYKKITGQGKDKLFKLSEFCNVTRGFTTGANDFFYVRDDTGMVQKLTDEDFKMYFGFPRANSYINWKNNGWYYSNLTKRHYLIERRFVKPLFKSQREAVKLDVDINNLASNVIMCSDSKDKLVKFKNYILKYILDAESRDVHKRPTCQSRDPWYNLKNAAVTGDFIFPSKIGEKYRLIDNRTAKVYCDKVNYAIEVKEKYREYADYLFLILNSIFFRYFIDLFSRQLTGSQTLSDVDVNVVENTLIINPELLKPYDKELREIYLSLKSREQGGIFDEIKQKDKRKLDTILFKILGLTEKDVDDLYQAAAKYVKDRAEKSASMKTTKTKQKLTYDETLKLIKDRFSDIRKYKELIKGTETRKIKIPKWKAKYPKDLQSEDLFGLYSVSFVEGNKSKKITFDSLEQLRLFKFLNEDLDLKDKQLLLPIDRDECENILQLLKREYHENINLIKNLIKTYRSKADPVSIYRDLLMS